jgi:LPS-assembly lipoprotein
MSWCERPARRRRALASLASLASLPALASLASLTTLSGCGFALRVPPKLGFKSIALTGFDARSPLADDLRRHIGTQVEVLADANKAEMVLHALVDQRQKSVVASTAAAQVREVQLRLRFEFRVATPAGRELIPRVELLLSRDMSYSETFALAKEQEEAELFRDMQSDVVAQVIRRLASIKL